MENVYTEIITLLHTIHEELDNISYSFIMALNLYLNIIELGNTINSKPYITQETYSRQISEYLQNLMHQLCIVKQPKIHMQYHIYCIIPIHSCSAIHHIVTQIIGNTLCMCQEKMLINKYCK